MKLRTELVLYTLLLASLNLLLSFGVIGLFARMGPAIEQILRENVASIDAAQSILAELAQAPGALSEDARGRTSAALQTIRANITEAEETPIINRLAFTLPNAALGDPAARLLTVEALRELIRINRDAMVAVDLRARRLGSAGAWAAVFIGTLSFALSLLILSLLRRRLVEPLLELHAVLSAARAGDRFRRCRPFDAPLELKQAAHSVNLLLDERLRP